MNLKFLMIGIFQCLISSFQTAVGTCTLPNVFRNSVWHDSTRGDLNFTNSTMSGWQTTAYSQSISQWECYIDSHYESNGYLIFKSLQKVTFAGVNFTGYMCMQLTKVTDYSFYYYLLYTQQHNAAEERILYAENATSNVSSICITSSKEPLEQFHVLIKSGYEWEARQYCPTPVLGNFDYTYTGSDGNAYCQNSSDQWRVCSDRQTMTFNYTTCNKIMAYSRGGQVWCVGTVTSSYTFFMVYNNDSSVDGSATFRFTCFSISPDGLKASMVQNNCTENQIPSTFAKRHDGQDMGAKLIMTPYLTCPFTSATPKAENVNVGAVVGGVLGGVVLIVVSVGLYMFYKRNWRMKRSSGQDPRSNVADVKAHNAPDPRTGHGQVKANIMLNLSPREDLKPTNDHSSYENHVPGNECKSPMQSFGSLHVDDYDGQFSPRVIM
ncbi:hypothetical protein CHS0354_026266 [Potamilus streckersoni]|uniref:DUF7042 domain-containing protein n=1 Tax=Potamilus streckersoni TaxID=2493646 RepID=A0AAE0W832_9BIVA|nr:hypothetical protein CHS0354_026266 [Potamilus streckersoni]